jgi:hypothetical protein
MDKLRNPRSRRGGRLDAAALLGELTHFPMAEAVQ